MPPMELNIVRHAIAEDGADDAARPLSKKGGVAQLEGEPTPAGMRLCTLLTPRVLRR